MDKRVLKKQRERELEEEALRLSEKEKAKEGRICTEPQISSCGLTPWGSISPAVNVNAAFRFLD